MATATFSGETASGWQQVLFAAPVAITANTVYLASYHCTVGHYSADVNYFTSKGADNPPLHALTNGVTGGNGVYAYGTSSAFPSLTWSAANYWVDVVFHAAGAPTLTSIAFAPANPSILAGASQQFTATGTYSDSSTQNITSQATWGSSNTGVAAVTAGGLATGVSAGTTTISAALAGVTNSTVLTVKTPSALTSIAVTPANPTNRVGTTQQFAATGTYSDGTAQNLTSQATWASSRTAVATINSSGLATGAATGITTISAMLESVSGNTTLTIQPPPLAITTTSLPSGTGSTAYTTTLAASGGTAPYTWSLAGGALPPGLTLSSTGVITGMPTTTGTSNFTVRAADATIPAQTANSLLSIIINSAGTSGLIGNTTEGTLTDTMWDGGAWINACRFQAASNMMVATMRAKVTAIPGKYKCAIYSDISSQPSRLLGSTAEVSNPASGWQSFPLTSSVALTKGSYYWLAIWSGDTNARVYYSGNNGTLRWGLYNYGTWPDPVSTTGGGNLNYCIYAMQ